MAWNSTNTVEMKQFLEKQEKMLNDNATNVTNYAELVARDVNSAQTQMNQSQSNVESALNALKSKNKELKDTLKTIQTKQLEDTDTTNRLRQEIQIKEGESKQANELNKLRKEQATSLHDKYDGNYHSSWMGLWVPLKSEFRVGLAVTTVAFFVMILVVLVFLYYNGYISSLSKQSIPTTIGGFRLKLSRI